MGITMIIIAMTTNTLIDKVTIGIVQCYTSSVIM